eukprot:jgi/Tetstr1/447911/TSEL_035219.t1
MAAAPRPEPGSPRSEGDGAPLLSRGGSLLRSAGRLRAGALASLRDASPLPVTQLGAICLTQLSQGFQVTLPYTVAVYMVRNFGYEDEAEVSRKTGLMASYYCLAMFLTSYLWGKVSDTYGRKPVVVIGNISSALTVLAFGWATTYKAACAARFFGGLMNGIMGSLKTMIGESCDAVSQGRALVYLTMSWGVGSTFGPLLGGFFAEPCDKYGWMPLCGPDEALRSRPFLLPCLVTGVIQVVATVASALLMEETLPATKQRRASPEGSPGAEGRPGLLGRKSAGRWFGRRGRGNPPKEHELGQVEPNRSDSAKTEESDLLAADGADMGETSEALQQKDAERAIGAAEEADAADLQLLEEHEDIEGGRAAEPGQLGGGPWWRQRDVGLCLLGYALIAFIFNLSNEVTPIYASAPPGDGGLGFSTGQLAVPYSVGGASLLAFGTLGFKRLQARFDTLQLARLGLLLSAGVWLLLPAASLAMPHEGVAMAAVCTAAAGRAVAGTATFTSSMVLVNVAAPPGQLGAVNGMGQAAAAFVRGVGPAVGGFAWALTLGTHLPGHQFIVFSAMSAFSLATVAVYGPHLQLPGLDGR